MKSPTTQTIIAVNSNVAIVIPETGELLEPTTPAIYPATAEKKKAATASLQQIIRELENTQETLWSPVVLNGKGMGLLANHSLVMANYVSRANAAIIDLKNLLEQG